MRRTWAHRCPVAPSTKAHPLELVHAGIEVAGFSVPHARDVRRSVMLGAKEAGPLVARLMTVTYLVVPAAVITVASGVGMVLLGGGFANVPRRIHVGLALALGVFVVGATRSSRAIAALGEALARDDVPRAREIGERLVFWLRVEDVLRFATLALMVLPV